VILHKRTQKVPEFEGFSLFRQGKRSHREASPNAVLSRSCEGPHSARLCTAKITKQSQIIEENQGLLKIEARTIGVLRQLKSREHRARPVGNQI
jgi:hypothetical protein